MDIDNDTSDGHGGGDLDLEQSLLQQFSCLGTTDKEELVRQLQKLLGSQLNESTASFFLDMNNWNLQAAICSYLDIEAPYKLPSMALVSNPLASETESVEPNVRFKKTWQIYNNGTERWPTGCIFQFSSGDNLCAETYMPVNCLAPGESANIALEMVSPDKPGVYQGKWRMCTSCGSYFGDPVWAIVTVVGESTIALTQQLEHFSELGSSPTLPNAVNPFGSFRHSFSQTQVGDAPGRPRRSLSPAVLVQENNVAPRDQDSSMC